MALFALFLFGLLISLAQGNYWLTNENNMMPGCIEGQYWINGECRPGFGQNYNSPPQLCVSKQQWIIGECRDLMRLLQANQYGGQPYQYESQSINPYGQPYQYGQPFQGAGLVSKALKGYKILHGIVKAIKDIHKNSKGQEPAGGVPGTEVKP